MLPTQQQKTGELVKVNVSASTIELKELPVFTRTEDIAMLERKLHSDLAAITENQTALRTRQIALIRARVVRNRHINFGRTTPLPGCRASVFRSGRFHMRLGLRLSARP